MPSATAKELIFEEKSRQKLHKGIDQLARVVAGTLGPKGNNVGLEKSWGAPEITNDGGSIVKGIALPDQYENMGASMAKEMVQKIKEKCGDGTTTGLLLLNALVSNGIKQIAAGANPTALKRGIEKAVETLVQELKKIAIPIKGQEEIRNIATVSASGNSSIGQVIAEAIEKTGTNGVITIEEAKGTQTTIEKVEGMKFDRGWISAYFCTNNDKMTVELENPQILILDKKVSNIHEILPLLNTTAQTARALLIIAEDVEADALSTLIINRLRGTLKVAAVKAPGFGDRRKAILEDIAVLTDGMVISDEVGLALKDVTAAQLGTAEKVVITKEYTTIINGAGKPEKIQSRINQIENEAAKATSDYDREKLNERKAKLSGGVAVIRVGAITEQEMKQLKPMYEDSLNSTRAAQQEGVVPGGGIALLRARRGLEDLKLNGDEALGAKLFHQACEAPFKQIVANTGHDGAVMLFEVESKGGNFGFNALTEKVEDMLAAGILDPVKVTIQDIIHAASTAAIVLITEALIGKCPEEEEAEAGEA